MKSPISFLKAIYPNGPWCLAAIAPKKSKDDNNAIEVRTFGPATEAECAAWIDKWNGKRNVYWHVNPVRANVKKKPTKLDIVAVHYLHVDIDPKNDFKVQPLKAQQDAILERLTERLPKGVPAPTVIVFSGGGYQAFWKLDTPIEIKGEPNIADDTGLFNVWLESMLGGDNCHNIDRLMRLPGTKNLLDYKKREQGRDDEPMAAVVDHDLTRVYSVGEFSQTTPKRKGQPRAKAATRSEVGTAKCVADLKELNDWGVPDRTKLIIAHGVHPDAEVVQAKRDKGADVSRSGWLWEAVCSLVRCGVPDEIILGILTDPEWGISESVLEMKGQAERYALKQIADAHDGIGVVVDLGLTDLDAERTTLASALKGTGIPVFLQRFKLMRIRRLGEGIVEKNFEIKEGTYILEEMTRPFLLTKLSNAVTFIKRDRKGQPYNVRPSPNLLDALLDHPEEEGFQQIKRLVHTPTLTRNEPGYDPATGNYLLFDPEDYPPVSLEPTEEDAVNAIAFLDHLLRGYQFSDAASRAAALGMLIAAVYRPEMRGCPMHAINAALPGSGKTKLAELAGILALGVLPPIMSYRPFDETENAKALETQLAMGVGVLVYDNVESAPLSGSTLNSILTNEVHEYRVLGGHSKNTVSTRTLFIATGNNIQIQGDLATRTIVIGLTPRKDDGTLEDAPHTRTFDFDPIKEAREHRPMLVQAALTVLRAFIAAGMPYRKDFQPMRAGTFDHYDMIRGALAWLGEDDPIRTVRAVDDPMVELKANVLKSLYAKFGDKEFTWGEVELTQPWVISRCPKRAVASLSNRREEWVPRAAQQAVGGLADVPYHGLRLRKRKDRTGTNVYWFEGRPSEALQEAVKQMLIREPLVQPRSLDQEPAPFDARRSFEGEV